MFTLKNLNHFRVSKKRMVILLSLVGVTLLTLVTIWSNLQQNKSVEEVCSEGIYEVGSAFIFDNVDAFYCMMCDPPSKKEELTALVNAYLTDERIADFYKRSEEHARSRSSQLDDVWVIFIEPSERLKVGEIPEPGTILGYFPEENTVAIVHLSDRIRATTQV